MDEIDRKIITQLQQDGRTTLEDLAKVTGFTSMGVKKRLQKLLDQGAVKTQALLNPTSLGILPAIVLLEMADTKAMQDLLARFKECPRVVYIFKTIGGYNLIALVVAEDQETLESISAEKCSLRSGAGIRRSEFYPIGDVLFSPFLPIREHLVARDRTVAPCGVDCEPCPRYKAKKCVCCPATKYYRGSL
jgi:DNA-binding Lrp family transcriptional regulator